jgi:hypothetical protein
LFNYHKYPEAINDSYERAISGIEILWHKVTVPTISQTSSTFPSSSACIQKGITDEIVVAFCQQDKNN